MVGRLWLGPACPTLFLVGQGVVFERLTVLDIRSTIWARPTDYDGIASPCVGERKSVSSDWLPPFIPPGFLVRRWRVGMARPGKRSGPGRRCRPHPAWCGDVGCRIALQHGAVLDVLPAGHHWASGFGRRPASLAVATKLQPCSFPC